MRTLWTPWRTEYVLAPKPDACVFCLPEDTSGDEGRLVLHRAGQCFVVMNRFPYACGHLMVAPFRHVLSLSGLGREESHDLMDMIRLGVDVLERTFSPDGVNVGLNIGAAAGAGIGGHLHVHLVPRWTGDHSFMAVFGETMVLSEHLTAQYRRLKPGFHRSGTSS